MRSKFFTESDDGTKLFLGAPEHDNQLFDITPYTDKLGGGWVFKPGCENISLKKLVAESMKSNKKYICKTLCQLKKKPKRKLYNTYQSNTWYTVTLDNSYLQISA